MAKDPIRPRELTGLPNIGATLAERLKAAGVETPAQLRSLGSVEALRRIKAGLGRDDPCLNMLFALEGAIRGIRWHGIPKQERDQLWQQYQSQIDE